MKKKFFCTVVIVIFIISICMCFVSCNQNSDKIIKVEYVCNGNKVEPYGFYENEYIRIFYDEAWFPNEVYIEIYDGSEFLTNFKHELGYNALYGQSILNSIGYIVCYVPNTYLYIFGGTFFDSKHNTQKFSDYNNLTIKVIKSDNEKILAEYIIKIF